MTNIGDSLFGLFIDFDRLPDIALDLIVREDQV